MAASKVEYKPSDFKFPPLPRTLTEVMQIVNDPKADASKLSGIIKQDPATSAYVLRTVNSAFYGVSREVSTIDRAITLLGAKEVCKLVIVGGLKRTFAYLQSKDAWNVFEHIMRTSMAAAIFAKEVAEHLEIVNVSEVVFSGGLLHQLGRLVLLYSLPDKYVPIWFTEGKDLCTPLHAIESNIFDTDYPGLGATMAEEWKLPIDLITAIRHHRSVKEVTSPYPKTITQLLGVGTAAAQILFNPEGSPSEAEQKKDLTDAAIELAMQRRVDEKGLLKFIMNKGEDVQAATMELLAG